MFDQIHKRLKPNDYMTKVLEKTISEECNETCRNRIQDILDLDISLLTKFIFIHESLEGAENTIKRLKRDQQIQLVQELEKIDLEANPGRVWMYNLIRYECGI